MMTLFSWHGWIECVYPGPSSSGWIVAPVLDLCSDEFDDAYGPRSSRLWRIVRCSLPTPNQSSS